MKRELPAPGLLLEGLAFCYLASYRALETDWILLATLLWQV
jgi:hypothetical protein